MNRQYKKYLQTFTIIMDFSMLNISFISSLLLFEITIYKNMMATHQLLWLIINIAWIFLSFACGNYGDKIINDFESFAKRTVQVYILWMISILVYLVFTKDSHLSRLFILFLILNFGIGLSLNRFLYFGVKNYLKIQHDYVNKVIILGFNETAKKLASYLEEEGVNIKLLGFTEDEKNMKELSNYPILANIGNTIKIAKELDAQEIFSTITPEQNKNIYQLMREAEKKCLRFKVVPNLSVFFRRPVVIDYIRDLPVLSLRNDPLEDVGNRLKKRFLDIIISSLVIVFILSWMIPILGLIILIESKGPIFFSQLRTGANDISFFCLKFRSMGINSDADTKSATRNDKRVTKVGAFIRKTSLDEFPQFINVFKGEMSLVGPRPHMVKHTSEFSKIVNQYMIRQLLKPGITGWAQINSLRGEITNPDQIKMRVASDLWYLEHWSIWLDLRIIFLTVYQVFNGNKNAY